MVEVDVLQGGERHNLLRDEVYDDLLRQVEAGEVVAMLAGVPCHTFSVARFAAGWARPVRGRRGQQHGLPKLTTAERRQTEESNVLVRRTMQLCEALAARGGDFIVENPIDRGDAAMAWVYSEPDHCPLWSVPEVDTTRRRTGARLVHCPQCAFAGASFQKWTTFMMSPAAAERAAHFAGLRCHHRAHELVAAGYDVHGEPTGSRAAAYPAGLNAELARVLCGGAEAEGEGEGQQGEEGRNGGEWLATCLDCWPEGPAVARAVAQPPAAAGRFSEARRVPEREEVVCRMPVDSAEGAQAATRPREEWQRRFGAPVTGRAPTAGACAAEAAQAWVDVGHQRRQRRAGFRGQPATRGAGALGNPFHMRFDGRGGDARAAAGLREAVCDAFGDLLRREPSATVVAEVAAAHGGLAFEPGLATAAAAAARLAAVRELAAEVEGGGRVELVCGCAPRRCHAEEIARRVIELSGRGGGRRGAGTVAADWRPQGGAAGLFWDAADWEAMVAWRGEAARAWEAMAAGQDFERPADLHIPARRMRPEARALAPWATDGQHAAAPVPVAQLGEAAPVCGLQAPFFHRMAQHPGEDAEICHELPWGFELDGSAEDIFLAFHHPSCYPSQGSATFSAQQHRQAVVRVAEAEGPAGTGWLQRHDDIPFVPLRAVPRGVVDQTTKLRIVTDHTYPFGFGISTNENVGLGHLPDVKLSSGVRYAQMVGVMQSAGAAVLLWKRDAAAAYRQVPMCAADLWKCGTVGPGGVMIDTRLSFGSRVAPNKFQRLMLVAVREVMRRVRAFDEEHPPADPTVRAWMEQRRREVADGRLMSMVQYIDDSVAVSVHDVVAATGRRRGFHHMEIFDAVMTEAGIAMAEDKKEASEAEIEALGVMVSAAEGCVYYPDSKRERLEAIMDRVLEEAAAGRALARTEIESLMGKLKWVAHIAPSLAPRLASGFAMAHARGRPPRVRASAAFVADQQLIRGRLASLPRLPLVPRTEFPPLQAAQSVLAFQDASGEWGVGGMFVRGGCMYFMQARYPPDVQAALRSRDISIATTELAAELAMVQLVLRVREGEEELYITNFTDNEAARAAATKGTASAASMAAAAEELARLVGTAGVALRTARVTTDENKITDGLSRGSRARLHAAAKEAGLRLEEMALEPGVWDVVRACYPGHDE